MFDFQPRSKGPLSLIRWPKSEGREALKRVYDKPKKK